MEDLYDKREGEGDDNTFYRVMDRIDSQKECGERIRKVTSGGERL